MASITVITATFNAERHIARLAADLNAQTDDDFEWIVMDGGSTDATLSLLPSAVGRCLTVVRGRDFGIYDALNQGLERCRATYYLVIGADDRLYASAIGEYRKLAASTGADIIAASVRDCGLIALPGRGKPWLRGQNAYISHHSVGTLIRRDLHERIGFYSRAFPIAADQLFIKSAMRHGAVLYCAPKFIAGEFSREGVSSVRYLDCQFQFTLIQLRTESHRALQLLLLALRVVWHWRKVLA